MFDKQRYITAGIHREIPLSIQEFLWELIDKLEAEKDYLQVFELYSVNGQQELEHRQECPRYKQTYVLQDFTAYPVSAKVFVIDSGDYATMLLAEEY